MLGIRHYRGCAVDLWCGDPAEFVADLHWEAYLPGEVAAGKHVAVTYGSAPVAALETLEQLRAALDGAKVRPRRLTLILPTLELYKEFQAALFKSFPEFDDD